MKIENGITSKGTYNIRENRYTGTFVNISEENHEGFIEM
jgi:hypothetical protein